MDRDPREEADYTSRQIEAARRVLVDLGQVLAAFSDAIVVVGGWVPDLLAPQTATAHIGSIDVDLALDVEKLSGGRYAQLVKLLLDTGRYELGDKGFQLRIGVDLGDGEWPVKVDVEFLAPATKLKKNRPKLLAGFRVVQQPAFAAAFDSPRKIEIEGPMISGVLNTVKMRVASLPDFIIMKAHAIEGRDKPKDVYDLCYCLEEMPNAIAEVAASWKSRPNDPLVVAAIEILRQKFKTATYYGSQQLANFHASRNPLERAMYARRAYELVQKLVQQL